MSLNSPADDATEGEAAAWAVRQRNGLDAQGRQQLQAWLSADERHEPLLKEMADLLVQVRQIPASEVGALRAGLSSARSEGESAVRMPRHRRAWPVLAWMSQAATAVLVIACVSAGWWGWRHLPTFESAYATSRGQQVLAVLPDDTKEGTRLHLDSATQVDVRLFRQRREVHLRDGQVMLTVHADAERPLDVLAGKLRITVLGTRFSVRHTASGVDAGRTVVSVEEGLVRVALASRDGGDVEIQSPPLELHAGQTVSGDASGRLGPVGAVSPAAVASWRSGRINFDNTPLDQALAEFERYGPTGLVVRDPRVARLTVGGSYGLRQHERFAEILPRLLPVRLEQQDGVTEIVAEQAP